MSNTLLKQIRSEIASSVTLILNQSLTTGIYIENLKIAKVLPVFKKGDGILFNNYRPISLLLSISQFFKTMLYNQNYKNLEIHNIITDKQYGFNFKQYKRVGITLSVFMNTSML